MNSLQSYFNSNFNRHVHIPSENIPPAPQYPLPKDTPKSQGQICTPPKIDLFQLKDRGWTCQAPSISLKGIFNSIYKQ